MKRLDWKLKVVGLLCGGMTLVTTATCNPFSGALTIFRDRGGSFVYDDYFYGGGGYYEETVYYDDYYYDDYYYDDCFDCW